MKFKFILYKFIPIFFFSSCEKAIEFDLETVAPKLVVEASIENGQYPIVNLSKSMGYFSNINPGVVQNNFVHNAAVFVSNGTQTHRLKEYTLPISGGYTFYYYTADPSTPATLFTGQLGGQYSLQIITDGQEYNASTSIPFVTRQVDSLFWKPAPADNSANKVVVMITAKDRQGFGDYIRYYTKRNGEPFYPGLNSVYDDQVIDGQSYTVQIERGRPRDGGLDEEGSFFNKGDTVSLKLANINKSTYDFWRTMEFSYASVGNPFSTPTKVLSNISNGALGYFGGYGAQYHQLIIPQ
ncbi:MAG: hypothetical protein RL115_238 [Bacteroidota bacterium]|jgi:hypothetical protein